MRNLFAVLALLALLPTLATADYTYVSRTWQNQNEVMSASLTVSVPVITHDAQGNPVTTHQTKWVHARIRLGQEAPLRKGEVEHFRVSAYASGTGHSATIHVHVDPDLVYHSYRGAWGTSHGGGHTYLRLFHNGRIKNLPPATFENVTVNFTDINAPFKMTFDDFAYDDNAQAIAHYAFEIKRDVFLFPDKLVAKGEIARPEQGQPTVTITKGCPFTADADEYFKAGKTYLLNLKVLREGSQYYADKWSEEARFKFKWKKSGAISLERIDIETPRVKVRNEKFRSLHRD